MAVSTCLSPTRPTVAELVVAELQHRGAQNKEPNPSERSKVLAQWANAREGNWRTTTGVIRGTSCSTTRARCTGDRFVVPTLADERMAVVDARRRERRADPLDNAPADPAPPCAASTKLSAQRQTRPLVRFVPGGLSQSPKREACAQEPDTTRRARYATSLDVARRAPSTHNPDTNTATGRPGPEGASAPQRSCVELDAPKQELVATLAARLLWAPETARLTKALDVLRLASLAHIGHQRQPAPEGAPRLLPLETLNAGMQEAARRKARCALHASKSKGRQFVWPVLLASPTYAGRSRSMAAEMAFRKGEFGDVRLELADTTFVLDTTLPPRRAAARAGLAIRPTVIDAALHDFERRRRAACLHKERSLKTRQPSRAARTAAAMVRAVGAWLFAGHSKCPGSRALERRVLKTCITSSRLLSPSRYSPGPVRRGDGEYPARACEPTDTFANQRIAAEKKAVRPVHD
ncbi:hypothetical protein AURDEDRAFT_159173 [Auricularia subglabra TFB-10046 SS5]|nr:hypothetical protein AURDEDRAFT_159173 [Auricularia subglabra TFB-10046 SS5]